MSKEHIFIEPPWDGWAHEPLTTADSNVSGGQRGNIFLDLFVP
jgi:hypothetical protein